MIFIPTASRQLLLKLAQNNSAAENWLLKLYTNNVTPGLFDTAASYTEAAGGGYVAKTLLGASWAYSLDGSNKGLSTYANQTWTFTGPLTGSATLYGMFVVRVTTGDLLMAERFSSSFQPLNNGDFFTYGPQVTATNE